MRAIIDPELIERANRWIKAQGYTVLATLKPKAVKLSFREQEALVFTGDDSLILTWFTIEEIDPKLNYARQKVVLS